MTIGPITILYAPVVQKVGDAICQIYLFPVNNKFGFPNTSPLDSNNIYPVDSAIQVFNKYKLVSLEGYPDKCENYKGKKGNMETIHSNQDGGRKQH